MLHGSTQITAGDPAVTLQPGNDGQSSQFAAPSQVVSELSFPGMLSAGDIPLWTEADERTASCSQVSICILILTRPIPLVKGKKQQKPPVFPRPFRDFPQFAGNPSPSGFQTSALHPIRPNKMSPGIAPKAPPFHTAPSAPATLPHPSPKTAKARQNAAAPYQAVLRKKRRSLCPPLLFSRHRPSVHWPPS